MFKNKIVCSLKHNNVPLAEGKDCIFIPFNTEYSVYLKNMSKDIALISLYINGRDVSPGYKIKIYPKCSATIEKFRDTDHRFVFKEKTQALQEVRLSNDEDGLIRLEVDFELIPAINPFQDHLDFVKRNCTSKTNPPKSNFEDIHTQLYKSSGSSLYDEGVKDNSSLYDKGPQTRAIANCISKNTLLDAAYNNLEATASLNSGVTLPGRKKENPDDVDFVKTKTEASMAINNFEFLIELKEASEPVNESKKKKLCPTCLKKFKYKYFFCPFDGTALD